MTRDRSHEGMQSVLRTLTALEAIAQLQPVRMSDLARELDLPKSTVTRILRTLREAGWAAEHDSLADQRWVLTARALAVGSSVASELDLRAVTRPWLLRLGAETDENIHLSMPDGDSLVLIDKVPSSRPVQIVTSIGDKAPMHLSGSGWAFLSRLPRAEAEKLLPDKLVATTPLSVTDRERLLEEIQQVAERGFAINPGRWRAEVAAVAAPIVNHRGRPIAALSISMPAYRLTEALHEPYGALVRHATREISGEIAGRLQAP